MGKTIPLHVRFERHVLRSEGCWNWKGSRNQTGYGQFHIGRKGGTISVHRWSYEHFIGPIPKGLWVLHKCDNPSCVKPDHLYAGTPVQNAQDAIQRNRRPKTHKFGSRIRKLTDDDVRAIRLDDRPKHEVAFAYGIAEVTVYAIKVGKRKAHVI